MRFIKGSLMLMLLLILFLGIGNAFAVDSNDLNSTVELDSNDTAVISADSGEIEVNDWDDLQYYASLDDKNYVLKLKENTNYYPTIPSSTDSQIIFNNNVTIIGSEGAYIGDSSENPRSISYAAMKVPDNNGVGITLKGVTFKWISCQYQPDAIFMQVGGNSVNRFDDCHFSEITTALGRSTIVHIKFGDLLLTNCSFTNCTTDFGCINLFNPKEPETGLSTLARMNVTDCYFEGNYAKTAPGCINNAGILIVRNSTFYKNSAFWWAGAICTRGGANTTLYDSLFLDNVAGWNGGALYTYSYLQIYNTTFLRNNCTTNNGGGAIGACKYQHAPYIYIQDSLFENNENTCWGTSEVSPGTGRGGAISIMDEGGLEVRNTTFIKNSACMGTAICAISGGLNYGSPYVILVGNRFINHTRIGDVLDIRLASNADVEIRDNYYYNDSFEFKKLKLISDEKIGDDVIINIDAELKNPNSFEADILDVTSYEVYVDGAYNKTVVGRTFNLTLENGRTCNVYAKPTISNSVTNEIFVGIPKEYVYVSQNSGKDTNDGLTRSTPLATISKAIDIAKSKGNIVLMDGTFNECNFMIDFNLNIIAENGAKFTGTMANTIFTVSNNSEFSLSNINFDNIVFTVKNTGILRQTSGFTTIDGCTFNSNYVSGLSGTTLIEAKGIEVYNSNFTNHDKDKIHITLIRSDDFLLDGCVFSDNVASYTGFPYLVATAGEKTGVKGVITDSIFKSNTVKYGCIYFGASSSPLTIENTRFVANSVGASGDHSSCIKLETSPTVRIDSCIFRDNVDLGSSSAIIYVVGGYSSVYVSNSIVLNNSYQNTNNAVFSASSKDNLKVYKNLNGNWWGNTWQNYTASPHVYEPACSSWLVLNMTANATELASNQKALVTFDFYNTYDKQDGLVFQDAGKLPRFELDISAVNGSASSSKASVSKGSGSVTYTLEEISGGSITASYADAVSTLDFEWAGLYVGIEAENVTYGNSTQIRFDLLDDLDESKLLLKINNDSYAFKKTLTIEKLNAGDYLINLTYLGDSKYNSSSFAKAFEVQKAAPQLAIDVNDTYYSSPVNIAVSSNSDATGEISIDIGGFTDIKTISNGNAEFSVDNLAAGTYEIQAAYSGDENYLPGSVTSSFTIKKFNSTISISIGNVEIGSDVVLTFAVNNDALGNVTVRVNGKSESVSLSNGAATYTIKSISNGIYAIEATYNGDAKYLSSKNATEIDIGRSSSDLNVDVSDITYGETAALTVTLNADATGNVSVSIDGENYTATVNNGKAIINISDLTAGAKTALIQYLGDETYLPGKTTKSFNVNKAKPTLTVDIDDIMFGKDAVVKITITKGATGTIEIVGPNLAESPQIPRAGLITRTVSGLSVGEYSISVSYDGDGNYLSANASRTFNVYEWDVAQWPNEGYDVKNTERSPYISPANGNVAWIRDIEGDIIGNMAIDSDGNIYVTTSAGIYCLKGSDGTINWIFQDDNAGENFSGISIGRGMVLAPKSGYKLFFINQTTGEKLNNNIYQGSSFFAPVVDEDANIYITSEYQTTTSSYNLVIVPYGIWEFSTNPIQINIGNVAPTTAPVLVSNNTVAVGTKDGLKIIDIDSKSVANSYNVITDVRPVVSENILYAISGNSIVAITPAGGMWKVNINGTAGKYISVGQNGEIYSITKEGVLYEYSTGEEVFIYDFKNHVDGGLLVGGDDKLYVGCANGEFYSIDGQGNLLWKISLNESISGKPVMDADGVIYAIAGKRVVAINDAPLKDSKLSASIDNVTYGQDVNVNVSIDGAATGNVSVNIGNYINKAIVENGHASFVISNLNAGDYVALLSYSGDARYKSGDVEVKFRVSKLKSSMDVECGNVAVGNLINVKVTGLPKDATGNVTLNINGIKYSQGIANGNASFEVENLAERSYEFDVSYPGDSNYDNVNYHGTVSVLRTVISEDMTRGYNSGVDFKATLIGLNSKGLSNADVEVIVDGEKSTVKTDANGILILNRKLAVGTHSITITNPLTGETASNSAVIVKRISDNANLAMDYNDGSKFKVRVYGDDGNVAGANEVVVMKINGKSYSVKTDSNGWASLSISFAPKIYTVTSEYKGYKVSNKVTVKSLIKAKNLSKKKSKKIKYSITLKNSKNKVLKSKKVTFKFRGKTYSAKTNKKGVATVTLKNIKVGKFNIKITYLKDVVTKKITIKK